MKGQCHCGAVVLDVALSDGFNMGRGAAIAVSVAGVARLWFLRH